MFWYFVERADLFFNLAASVVTIISLIIVVVKGSDILKASQRQQYIPRQNELYSILYMQQALLFSEKRNIFDKSEVLSVLYELERYKFWTKEDEHRINSCIQLVENFKMQLLVSNLDDKSRDDLRKEMLQVCAIIKSEEYLHG